MKTTCRLEVAYTKITLGVTEGFFSVITLPAGPAHVRRWHSDVDCVTLLHCAFRHVRLYRRNVVVAKGQPTACKPVKGGGPAVLVWPSPAPDSNCVATNRRHSRAGDYLGPRPRSVHRLGRQHAGARDRHCEIVLCSTIRQLRSVRRCQSDQALLTLIRASSQFLVSFFFPY